MQVKTFSANSFKEVQQRLMEISEQNFNPGVAIIFASVDIDLEEMIVLFRQKNIRLFGCSSCGEFIFDNNDQVISDGGVVCMLIDMIPSSYSIKLFPGNGLTSYANGQKIGDWAKVQFEDPGLIVLASGLDTDGEQLVKGIQSAAGEKITMYGGLAGDDAKFKNTFVFSETTIESNGVILMALDKAVYDISGIATSGWVGIGADKIITKSDGNIVYTIDDQPALDVYKEYLSVRDEDLPEIGVEYPLLVKKPGNEDILRAVINVDVEKKLLIFAGTVEQGAIVTFSSSPGFEIIDLTKKKIEEFYQRNMNADALLLFSCMARHNALGPTISEEINEAWQKWNVPLTGFFSYGEIGSNFNSVCNFHNETFTLVALKERP
ncbi:MAG: FIST N-terminal domain-containing protein [Bacteroidota bacterium]